MTKEAILAAAEQITVIHVAVAVLFSIMSAILI